MTELSDLYSLRDMLEKATSGYGDLDYFVRRTVVPINDRTGDDVPYSSSVDAALSLVALVAPDSTGNTISWRQRSVGEPGWCGYWASMVPAGERSGGRVEAYAPTIPLVILKSLISALIATKEQPQ